MYNMNTTKDLIEEGWRKVRSFQKTIEENEMLLRNSEEVIEKNKKILGKN